VGEAFSLGCALAWAVAVILFRRSGESVPPLALNLFRVGTSSVLFVATLAVLDRPLWGAAPWRDYAVLAASGIIAIALADTLFHMSLNRVGAGVNAVIDTMYSPFITFFAFVVLGERMGPWQMLGMVFIVGSVLLASRVQPPRGTAPRTLAVGVALGVGAMASLAFGIVIAKPVLERSDVVWATTVRQLASLLVLAPAAAILPQRRRLWRVFVPDRSWRFSLPGTLFGSYVALLMWIAGMKHTAAGTAAILNQTSTIYILLLATLVLKEPFSRRKGLAAAMAVTGVVLVLRPWAMG
jgi:drug/metabolite transporter (DMT)-like permease